MNFISVIAILVFFKGAVSQEIIVDISDGSIQGTWEVTQFSNTSYYAFYSIRYGEPPIGNLRFQAPVPAKLSNDTVYNATYERNYCFQVTTNSEMESEDCLFLNVFVPESAYDRNDSLLPVMFFVPGGGFYQGSGFVMDGYGPEFFMDHDIILVSVNYRLGPFGFFSTHDEVIPGNAGLKDVHLALQWVNTNIKYFGGDPEKVTLFGHGAGAACASYQLLNPESEGLFRAVILQSGTSLNPWAFQRNQTDITFRTAGFLDRSFSEDRNSTELFEYLLDTEARDIDTASRLYYYSYSANNIQIQQGYFYGPDIENHTNNPFLTKPAYESFKNGDYIKVPAMIGTTAEEGLSLLSVSFQWTLAAYDRNLKLLVPNGLHISDDNVSQTVADLIKEHYTQGQQFQDNILAGIKFHSDQDFTKSLIKDAELQARNKSVYFYEFAYHGAMGDFPQQMAGAGNVSHGEDQNYIFNRKLAYSGLNNADIGQFPDADQVVHHRYLKLLVNFATYLDPTPDDDDELLQNIRWPTVKPDDFEYLEIGQNLTVKKNLKQDTLEFWDNLYQTYGIEPFETF